MIDEGDSWIRRCVMDEDAYAVSAASAGDLVGSLGTRRLRGGAKPIWAALNLP